MAGSGKRWFMGCGLGCLAVVLLVGGLVGGGAFVFRQSFSSWREAAAVHEELREAQGRVGDYRPPWDGAVGDSRAAAFAAVRGELAPQRSELAVEVTAALARLEGAGGKLDRMRHLVAITSRLGPRLAAFSRAQAAALLAAGLGPGEYVFLHDLTAYGLLGRDPADGVDALASAFRRGDGDMRVEIDGTTLALDDPAAMATDLRRLANERHRRWLAGMLDAAPERPTAAERDRIDGLRAELQRLGSDPEAVPWATGLPPYAADALAPCRQALLAAADGDELIDLIELLILLQD